MQKPIDQMSKEEIELEIRALKIQLNAKYSNNIELETRRLEEYCNRIQALKKAAKSLEVS